MSTPSTIAIGTKYELANPLPSVMESDVLLMLRESISLAKWQIKEFGVYPYTATSEKKFEGFEFVSETGKTLKVSVMDIMINKEVFGSTIRVTTDEETKKNSVEVLKESIQFAIIVNKSDYSETDKQIAMERYHQLKVTDLNKANQLLKSLNYQKKVVKLIGNV